MILALYYYYAKNISRGRIDSVAAVASAWGCQSRGCGQWRSVLPNSMISDQEFTAAHS